MSGAVVLTSEECDRLGRALSTRTTTFHVTHDGMFARTVAAIIERRLAEEVEDE